MDAILREQPRAQPCSFEHLPPRLQPNLNSGPAQRSCQSSQFHGLIPLVVVGGAFVNSWAAFKVARARKKYGIAYPQMYAEQSDKNAKAFNCVQRAHQNLLENMPFFLTLLFTSAIYRPVPAAILGTIRLVGLIVYVQGYATGDPAKRTRGAFGYIGRLGAIVLTVEASFKMLGYL